MLPGGAPLVVKQRKSLNTGCIRRPQDEQRHLEFCLSLLIPHLAKLRSFLPHSRRAHLCSLAHCTIIILVSPLIGCAPAGRLLKNKTHRSIYEWLATRVGARKRAVIMMIVRIILRVFRYGSLIFQLSLDYIFAREYSVCDSLCRMYRRAARGGRAVDAPLFSTLSPTKVGTTPCTPHLFTTNFRC